VSSPEPRPRETGGPAALLRGFLVLGVAVLVLAGLLRTCTFAPGAPEVDRASVPRIDAPAELRAASYAVPFPVRVPTLPADWIPQSSDVVVLGAPGDPAAGRAVRVGYLTPENQFARLLQSSGDEAALVVSEGGNPQATGTVGAGGRTWVTHEGRRGEALWVADVDGVRLAVTGSADAARLTQLAEAALVAPPAR
jgi:Protein of unknown function (DUF4245)